MADAESADIALSEALDERLTAPEGTFTEACHTRFRPDTPGVATKTVAVPAGIGVVDARLDGTSGDWDLAVFDAAGEMVAADASPDAQEIASGYTAAGGVLKVQACRRSGDADSVPVALRHGVVRNADAAADAVRADPPQLVDVHTESQADKTRLTGLGLDMTEHGGRKSLGVVLHGRADRDKLRQAGFTYRVVIEDLVAQSAGQRRNDARFARSTRAASELPSGRDVYRVLADYNAELKKLAEENPGLVKLITLPNKTYLGKDVLGVEITTDVDAKDGKPAFFNMGVHHAREWPAGELTMEWALELVRGYKANEPRARRIVESTRNLVVPIVNPDGFDASRTAGRLAGQDGGRNEEVPDTAYFAAGGATGGEYRRKNCRLPDDSPNGNCLTSVGLAEPGVDPNRNYGGLWGGPGADTNVATQTYRGPGPFSEPETRNVQALVSRNQVMSLITNHTTAALFLRAPGLASLGDPVDENKGYKALGDAVAKETGYFSQKSFELYDTTGTTEDWSYNATGGFGFTNEIYCGAPNYETGDCDDPAFHPTFPRVVEEWTGKNDVADYNLPGAPTPDYDGGGNREGFYLAAESAMNEARHSVLDGSAPAGTTLRLKKSFKTETFPQPQANGAPDAPLTFDDTLETTYEVGSSGAFRWHVNPSTRPIVAKERGDREGGTPSPAQKQQGGPAGYSGDPVNDGAAPAPQGGAPSSLNYNDHPITIPTGGDNRSANVRVSWRTEASDWDIEIFEDLNGNGRSDAGDKSVGTSANGITTEEEVGITGTPRLEAGKKYVLRVVNFAAVPAVDDYTVDITFNGPEPFKAAQRETYTLTCERGGSVVSTQQVFVERGQVISGMDPCNARQVTPVAPVTPVTPPTACAATSGFVSVGASRRGRGANLSFRRRASTPVTVDVFRQSVGRRVIGERLVARFTKRSSTVRWNGRGNRGKRRALGDGYYFVRYSTKGAAGTDVRRVVLQRTKGRFTKRADFFRRGACDLLPRYKLERPVFGGSGRAAPLGISYRLARAGRVTVTVTKGTRVVKRYAARSVAAGRTIRLRLSGKGLTRGEYRVRLSARETSGATVASTLVSRKL